MSEEDKTGSNILPKYMLINQYEEDGTLKKCAEEWSLATEGETDEDRKQHLETVRAVQALMTINNTASPPNKKAYSLKISQFADGSLCLSCGNAGMESDLVFASGAMTGDPVLEEQKKILNWIVEVAGQCTCSDEAFDAGMP